MDLSHLASSWQLEELFDKQVAYLILVVCSRINLLFRDYLFLLVNILCPCVKESLFLLVNMLPC